MEDICKRIALVTEMINPKYINLQHFKKYDDYAYSLYMKNDKNKLKDLLSNYESKIKNLIFLDKIKSPAIRYFYLMPGGFHDSIVKQCDISKTKITLTIDGLDALCWPRNLAGQIVITFYGISEVKGDKIIYLDENVLTFSYDKMKLAIRDSLNSLEFLFDNINIVEK